MTWTRGIRNLTRHPLYLIITLLPVLLITLLLFPLMQNVTALIEQIAAQQAYGTYYEYHEEWSAPEALQLAGAFMPILGMGLLISLVSLLTQLLLTPIAFQYLATLRAWDTCPAGLCRARASPDVVEALCLFPAAFPLSQCIGFLGYAVHISHGVPAACAACGAC